MKKGVEGPGLARIEMFRSPSDSKSVQEVPLKKFQKADQ